MGQRAHDETSSEPCGCRRGRGDLQASQVALVLKNLTANAGDIRDLGLIPGSGRSPGERNCKPLPWTLGIQWTEDPGRLYKSMGPQRVGHDYSDLANTGDLKVESTKAHRPNSIAWVQVLVSRLINIYCRLYHSLAFNTKLYASVSYGH